MHSSTQLNRDFDAEAVSQDLQTRAATDRVVELSFSSECPVARNSYIEILSHNPADVDLSKLNNGGPLLVGHNLDDQVGVVEEARIVGGKGRAKVRFGNSVRATEIYNDVVGGIRRLVSTGYSLTKQLSETRDAEGNRVCRFAWSPAEISWVPCPADQTVGVGRSANISTQIRIMSDNSNYSSSSIAEINAIATALTGRVDNVENLAARAIASGHTVQQFRDECRSRLPEARPVIGSFNDLSDVKPRDWQRYSLSRAVLNGCADGFERECSSELARRSGKAPSGFYVPNEIFTRGNSAGTASLGGVLVPTTPEGFINALRNKCQVLALGAQAMELSHPITIPRQSGVGTVNFVGETTASTLTSVTFQNLSLVPYAVAANHEYSKQLLITGSESVDSIIRNDILATIAEKIDLAALSGAGTTEPLGIANTSGVQTMALGANGLSLNNATAFPALCSLEGLLAASNADFGALSYLMRGTHRASLKKQVMFASTASPIWTTERVNGENRGVVNGYNAAVSNQIFINGTVGTATTLCSAIYFSDWSDAIVASFGNLDLVTDPYTKAESGIVRLLARKWCDVGVRTPAKHSMLLGILAT